MKIFIHVYKHQNKKTKIVCMKIFEITAKPSNLLPIIALINIKYSFALKSTVV